MLQVINKAKDAFKNKTPEMQAALVEATKSTEEVFNSVVSGLENAARGTTSSPASSSPAASPAPTPKSTVVSSGNNTNTAPDAAAAKVDSPSPVKKEGTPKAKRPPTTGEPLSSRDSIKMLQQEFSSRDPEEVFEVMEKLGEGASGAVYRATHKETKRLLAIKKYVPNTALCTHVSLTTVYLQDESRLEQRRSDRERNQNHERLELSLRPQVLRLLQKGRIHLGT